MATYGSGLYGAGLYGFGGTGETASATAVASVVAVASVIGPGSGVSAATAVSTATATASVTGPVPLGPTSLASFTFAFEMATTSTPRTVTPSYTNLSTYVMAGEGISLSRGRGSEQEATAQPGRGSVTLRNTDGRFTWGNGSSPYAPLQLRRPCRFRVTYSATTYDLWQGFVDEWSNDRVQTTGVARLTLSDRLARANRATLPALLDYEIEADGPVVFLPMQETTGPVADAVSGTELSQVAVNFFGDSEINYGAADGPGFDGATWVEFVASSADPYNGRSLIGSLSALAAITTSASAEFFMQKDSNDGLQDIASVGSIFNFSLDAAGLLVVDLETSISIRIEPGIFMCDGRKHHVAATAAISGGTATCNVYVDGSFVGSGSGPAASFTNDSSMILGGYFIRPKYNGYLSHLAVYDYNIGGTRVAAHAAAGLDGFAGESSLERFERICTMADLPSSFYATSGATDVAVGALRSKDVRLLDAVREVAAAERGAAYVTRAGVLTLATSRTRYNTAVGVTLDATKAGQVLAGDFQFQADDQFLVNQATASRPDGNEFVIRDTTSIDAYDLYESGPVQLNYDRDNLTLNWAQWEVATGKDPRPRCESVTVDVVGYASSGGNLSNLLNADLGTKVRVSSLPSDVYASSTLDLFIEGVRHDIGRDAWRITFTTSPVGLEDTVWILGTDLLGVGTVLGF